MCSGSETGSHLRLIDSCITQLKAQGTSRACIMSKEEEEDLRLLPPRRLGRGLRLLETLLHRERERVCVCVRERGSESVCGVE